MNIGANYKGFDFGIFFYGVQGNQIWNNLKWWNDFYTNFQGAKSSTALYDSWRPDHTNATAPIQENTGSFSTTNVPNSYYVEKDLTCVRKMLSWVHFTKKPYAKPENRKTARVCTNG